MTAVRQPERGSAESWEGHWPTYDKATQDHHVVLNLALGYLNARTGNWR